MSYGLPKRFLGTPSGDRKGTSLQVTDLRLLHDHIWPLVETVLHSDDRMISALERGEDDEAVQKELETIEAIEQLRTALLEANRV